MTDEPERLTLEAIKREPISPDEKAFLRELLRRKPELYVTRENGKLIVHGIALKATHGKP
jgi:hypothetical protein